MHKVVLDASPISLEQVRHVARAEATLALDPGARKAVAASRALVDATLADKKPHYGINTGFGSLSRRRIGADALRQLQVNLVRSHAAGIGEPLPIPTVRAMMLILAASLTRALSGVRPVLIERILDLLNASITPVVPCLGSVGASGDLAPLAHAALVLIGEGEAFVDDRRLPGAHALAAANLQPIELEAKEGLALLNGTHLMAAQAALLCARIDRLFDAALLACAMSIDAAMATHVFLDPRVYDARNQPGPARVASHLRTLLTASTIAESHRENDERVQDPYSFRCAPIVLGAALDAFTHLRTAVDNELGAVTDNPLILPSADNTPADIVSAGNFHGMPLAIPLDTLTIALAHIAGIAERRIFWLMAAREPESGLHPCLAPNPGLESGLMIAQYTAAACCNEIIGLATPASVANISTSAGIEDYNSFGPRAAAKADRAAALTERVIAIELICAAEGVELHRPHTSGKPVEDAIASIRRIIPHRDCDRPPGPDIELLANAIADGALTMPHREEKAQ
jgi:histidine ammonia-lyase